MPAVGKRVKSDLASAFSRRSATRGIISVDKELRAKRRAVICVRADQFTLKQTDVVIFLRVGDVIVLWGHRDGKTRPTKFATGTEVGAFLTACSG